MSENSVRHSMTPTYSHELNAGVNMSYNIDDMLLTRFYRVMLVSCLVGSLSCSLMLTVFIVTTSGSILVLLTNSSHKTSVISYKQTRLAYLVSVSMYLSLWSQRKPWMKTATS